jgi:hypothetical protein
MQMWSALLSQTGAWLKKFLIHSLVSILAVTRSSLFLYYGTSSMLHAHSSQGDLAACTLRPLTSNKHMTLFLDRSSGNTCSAHARRLIFSPLFKTCMTLMNTSWRIKRRLLKCTLTQVWSRAAHCPLCFSLYINDVDEIAEGVQGAVTGTTGSSVTHLLYADDLTLMANDPPCACNDRMALRGWDCCYYPAECLVIFRHTSPVIFRHTHAHTHTHTYTHTHTILMWCRPCSTVCSEKTLL